VWDTLRCQQANLILGHTNRVSCIGTSSDGKALATGSWDFTMKIWA
jgi:guanine nucleotide-binding protein G(I)/G(S)/G(T) subunit beta-1